MFHDTPLHTEKLPYRFPHTAAALSFTEQVAVRFGAASVSTSISFSIR